MSDHIGRQSHVLNTVGQTMKVDDSVEQAQQTRKSTATTVSCQQTKTSSSVHISRAYAAATA